MSSKRRPRASRAGGFARHSGEDRGCDVECLGCLLCVHCGIWTYRRASKRSWRSSTDMADLSACIRIQPAQFLILFADKVPLPPSSHCRHASIRTLEEQIVSLGACWAFSIQPVLPSVWRPVVVLLQSGTWARRLTQSPELGFGFCLFSSQNDFDFVLCLLLTRLPQPSCGCCCAMVRTLLHSPIGDAAAPPAFLPWPQWLASFHSFHHARPASVPSV
jgi:hypothetical protein